MKIAFISTILSYPWGGADTLWTHAAEAASTRGDRLLLSVSASVAAHPRISALTGAGAETVIRTPVSGPPSFGTRVQRKLGLARPGDACLIAALQSFQPDRVIFSQGGTYDLLLHPALVAWLRAGRIPFRVIANWQEEHPHLDDAGLAAIRAAFAAAEALYFVSTRNLATTRRHLLAPLPQARVLQNPLRWTAADVTPWPADPVARLATVSRLDEGKGLHLLLHALAAAADRLPAWRLDLFGTGPHEARLREMVTHLGLGDRVHLRGYVADLRSLWAGSQLMISPAIDDGVPMTIPEAMLCQRPVLATCVGGAEDWIAHGETGYLCAAPTVPLLTASLLEAFASQPRWSALGRAAAAAASARYRPDDYRVLLA